MILITLINLHKEKLRLEGQLEEINRSLGYVQREFYQDRKRTVTRRLDEIESILEDKPMPIAPIEQIQQFFVSIPK